jgi:hypothetical protein
MSDWQSVFAPMEQALEQMLDRTVLRDDDSRPVDPAMSGAVPHLDEVLAPVARVLLHADEHARAADMHLEDSLIALTALRDQVRAFHSEPDASAADRSKSVADASGSENAPYDDPETLP